MTISAPGDYDSAVLISDKNEYVIDAESLKNYMHEYEIDKREKPGAVDLEAAKPEAWVVLMEF